VPSLQVQVRLRHYPDSKPDAKVLRMNLGMYP
jgi:hypothetical protein